MKPLLSCCLLLAALAPLAWAADTAEVTLKGTLTCGKCDMKQTSACQNVLKVQDGATTTNYYLADNALSKKSHAKVCSEPKDNVTVTGIVADKDGKKVLTPTKIEFPTAAAPADSQPATSPASGSGKHEGHRHDRHEKDDDDD